MASQSTDILAAIGAIQTLIENFPMGILSSLKVKTYSSSLDFLIDALRTLGVNDKEVITFVLENIVGVNNLDYSGIDEFDNKFKDNAFIQGLESSVKFLLSEILANIISCSVWPKVPSEAIEEGYDLPLSILDPTNILTYCPTSDNGRKKYIGITPPMTPYDLATKSTDMNAFIWHGINMLSPMDTSDWKGKNIDDENRNTICTLQNKGYKKIRFKIGDDFSGKTLFEFNKKYLDNITIFSSKLILTNIIEELLNGLPNIEVNRGFDEIYNEAVFQKMIDTIVSNDDMEVDDCYYTFSNEDWNKMLEDAELKKYNAKKYGDKANTANVINKEAINNALNQVSSEATLHDRIEVIGNAIYDAAKTNTIEYDLLSQEASIEKNLELDYEVNSAWLYNILSTIIRPIVKAAMTPKVMALILMNYEIAGSLNLSEINMNSSIEAVLSFVKQKMLGLFAALVKRIKDSIIKAVLDLFKAKIEPLIAKYTAAKLLEQLENYLDLLRQAMECVTIFGLPYLLSNGIETGIDEVNYADITQIKNNPNKVPC